MSGITKTRPCPRCERELFLNPEKIAALAAEIKIEPSLAADEDVYKKRIAVCNGCEALREKTLCFFCGCFILFRARPAKGYCPHPNGDKWMPQNQTY